MVNIIEARIRKIRAYSKAMIRKLIAVDLKLEMLSPALFDKRVSDKWDGSPGAHGFEVLRTSMYFDSIRELTAISLDRYPTSPSIHNILEMLQSKELLQSLREEYCKPLPINWVGDIDGESKAFWEERFKERETQEASDRFNTHLRKSKQLFKELKQSEYFNRVKRARNKLVAHCDMVEDDGNFRPFEPTDVGLKWNDPEEYFKLIQPIITELVLLTSNEAYSLDISNGQHKAIAKDFWNK